MPIKWDGLQVRGGRRQCRDVNIECKIGSSCWITHMLWEQVPIQGLSSHSGDEHN